MIVALGQYDWSLAVKKVLLLDFFRSAVRGQGTSKHYEIMEKVAKVNVIFSSWL